jgi:ubiquinone/menaquinone biosynthesis C-methylase UbiE
MRTMNSSPEEIFYSSQNQTASIAMPSEQTALAFARGMRYSIINESLSKNHLPDREMIVELGCSNGEKLLYLKSLHGFSHALGIDLCFLNEKIEIENTSFISANLNQSWPLSDQSVDVLIAMMLLEHLFNPYAAFREIKRVVKPSGRAFVNLPLVTSVKNRLRLFVGKIPVTSVPYARWQKEGHWDGFHLHYFTIPSIQDLAAGSGLRIESVRGVGRASRLKTLWPAMLCDEISIEFRHAV